MIRLLLSVLSCRHARHTFPITLPGQPTRVKCLVCGRLVGYDWERMMLAK